jgi:hypothetical protein
MVCASPHDGSCKGVVAIWDLGGLASTVRERRSAMPVLGASYRRLPSWAFRAFGIWCILFGIGQLIYISANLHAN